MVYATTCIVIETSTQCFRTYLFAKSSSDQLLRILPLHPSKYLVAYAYITSLLMLMIISFRDCDCSVNICFQCLFV